MYILCVRERKQTQHGEAHREIALDPPSFTGNPRENFGEQKKSGRYCEEWYTEKTRKEKTQTRLGD